MSRIDQKLAFDRWCTAFGIEGERRDRLWSIMLQNSLTPDDVNVYFLGAAGVLEKVADMVTASNDALPAKMNAVGKRLVAQVGEAATAQATANLNRMSSEAAASMFETVKAAIAETVASQRVKLGAGLIGGAVAIFLAGNVLGWNVGSSNVSSVSTEWAATVARNDSRTWLQVMAANPDLNASIRNYCGTGSTRARVVNGARACDVPLWLEGAVAPASTGTVSGVSSSVLDWLYGWGPVWLLTFGLLAGLLGRKLLRATVSWKPLRWILD